jgi:hypothetical protein
MPGQTVMTHKDPACPREVLQRLYRLDVVVAMDDIGLMGNTVEIVRDRNAGRGNLSGDVAELWAVDHRDVARGVQPQRKFTDHNFGARTACKKDIRNKNTQRSHGNQDLYTKIWN